MSPEEIPQLFVLDEESATKLVRAVSPAFAHEPVVKHVGGGADNEVYRTKNGYYFRFSNDADASKMSERESQLLPVLQESLNVRIPRVEEKYSGRQPNGNYFFAYQGIDGIRLSPGKIDTLNGSAYDALTDELARFLSQMRRFPIDEAQKVGVPELDLNDVVETVSKMLDSATNTDFTQEEMIKLKKVLTAYPKDDRNSKHERALVHGDLGPEHILYDI